MIGSIVEGPFDSAEQAPRHRRDLDRAAGKRSVRIAFLATVTGAKRAADFISMCAERKKSCGMPGGASADLPGSRS
jgi:hypothetical protein